jgi:hypothetical protein
MKRYTLLRRISIVLAGSGLAAAALAAPLMADQTSSDAVVGPGGSSPATSTSPKAGPSVTLPTAPTSNIDAAGLDDVVAQHLGHPVDRLTFTITNKSIQPESYTFNNGQQFDVVITDSTGKQVWTWSKGQIFSQLMTHVHLNQGQSHSYTVVWNRRDDNDVPVPAGQYTAAAALTNQPRLVVAKTTTINPALENRDPTNVTLPSPGAQAHNPQVGNEIQTDITPPPTAKVTITVGS